MPLVTAGEWVRSTWAYQPIALGHTGSTIVRAIHSVLTQAGWSLASWSGTADDRYYLRADRNSINFRNDAVGTAGNVAMSETGANITVSGMSGGTVSEAATGFLTLTGQPADGETFTVSDGTTSVTFEFDSNSSVTGGNVAVTIGNKVTATLDAAVIAVNAHAFAVTASLVSDVWRFNGDSVEQNCGIHVLWNTGSARIEISAFLENTAGTASQVETTTTSGLTAANQKILVVYNNTLANDYIIYAGEDGLYLESGTGGAPQNIAHGMIATIRAIPQFSGTRDAQRKWSSQGLAMDLFGAMKFSEDRNFRFVDNAGANKNYTARLAPTVPRGTTSCLSTTQFNGQSYYVGPADNFIGQMNGGNTFGNYPVGFAFGLLNSPIDDHYKLSPLWLLQHAPFSFTVGVSSASASNNVAAGAAVYMTETRWIRVIPRVVVPDGSLLPFVNITDDVTSKIYRITRVADSGRNATLGIEYPSTAVTIPTTPTV